MSSNNDLVKKGKIFLSYGHDEYRPDVLRIKTDLEKRGYAIWFDEVDIKEGIDYETSIEEGLQQCDVVILIMTPYSVRRRKRNDPNSSDGYCLNEIAKALEKRKLIIPILLVYLDDGPPTSICRIQYLDLRDSIPINYHNEKYQVRFERLIRAIEAEDLDFEGGQARLQRYLRPLNFDKEISKHIARFIGRDWLFKKIDTWLSEMPKSRVFWLCGGPGIGKTAIATYLCHKYKEVIAYHLCIAGHEDKGDPRRAILSIAYQIAQHLPQYDQRLKYLELESEIETNTQTLFETLIVQPLSHDFDVGDNQYIIVIDAIDEAKTGQKNEIAQFIQEQWGKTPPWLRLVITSRPESDVITTLTNLDPFVLDAHQAENLNDMNIYLIAEFAKRKISVSQEILDQIIDKSEGYFLYLVMFFEEWDTGKISLDDIEAFPRGLWGVYKRFFQRQFQDHMLYVHEIKPVLECICAQREPLPITLLAEVIGISTMEFRRRVATLGSLFPIHMEVKNSKTIESIGPFHKSLRDWLTGTDDRTGFPLADVYAIDPVNGHKVLAQKFLEKYRSGSRDFFTLNHLPSHLLQGNFLKDLEIILTDLEFVEAKCSLGLAYELINDYENVKIKFFLAHPVLTSRIFSDRYGIFCPLCLGWSEIDKLNLGKVIPCPQCNKDLLINDFSIYSQWFPSKSQRKSSDEEPIDIDISEKFLLFKNFVKSQIHILAKKPELTLQQAVNQPVTSIVSTSAIITLENAKRRRYWFKWVNKPSQINQCLMTLTGHMDWVNACAVSPDGRLIVSGSDDKTIKIWDTRTGNIITTLTGHSGQISCCRFSPDGKKIISGSLDCTMKIWDSETFEVLRTLTGHSKHIKFCSFFPDGSRIISCSYDDANTIKIWDSETGREIAGFKDTKEGNYRINLLRDFGIRELTSCAISPDGKQIVYGSYDASINLFDIEKMQIIATFHGHSKEVISCDFSPDGKNIVSSSQDRTIKLWDLKECLNHPVSLEHSSNAIFSSKFSQDNKKIIFASADNSLKVWDVENANELNSLYGHSGGVTCCAFFPDAKKIVSGSFDKTLKIWNIESDENRYVQKHSGLITACTISPNNLLVVTSSFDKKIKIWNLESGSLIGTLSGHSETVIACIFSPDGGKILSGSYDKSLILWDAGSGEIITKMIGHTGFISTCIFSPDGNEIISGSLDSTIKIWDISTGTERKTLCGTKGQIKCLDISPDGNLLVSGSEETTLRVWDIRAGEEKYCLSGHESIINVCKFSPDGNTIVSVSWDRTIKLWDSRTGIVKKTLTGHSSLIHSCSFSPDGKRLVSCSHDTTVKIWDILSGKELFSISDQPFEKKFCAFSPDGRRIILGFGDTVMIYDIQTKKPLCTFIINNFIISMDISSDGKTIVVGDKVGEIYVLSLKEHETNFI